jgi:hypothetical protein
MGHHSMGWTNASSANIPWPLYKFSRVDQREFAGVF